MASLKVFYDKDGKSLTVWFDNPEKEAFAEETTEEVLLIKDKEGHVIGFERLNFEIASAAEQLEVEKIGA